ncbi:MAG: hypothetical protein KDD34_00325, partial [Bdellovibrionales bacterium]|nr:hypothetical protein [Bdellovibrionales bacterium]
MHKYLLFLAILLPFVSFFDVHAAPVKVLRNQLSNDLQKLKVIVDKKKMGVQFDWNLDSFISNLQVQMDKTDFVELNLEDHKPRKSTRTSAFYVHDDNRIFLSPQLESPGLITHELIKDEHYHISAGLNVLLNLKDGQQDDLVKKSVANALNKIISYQYIDGKRTIEMDQTWYSSQIGEFQALNGRIVLGGDLAGGGGDEKSFNIKSKVIQIVMEEVSGELLSSISPEKESV